MSYGHGIFFHGPHSKSQAKRLNPTGSRQMDSLSGGHEKKSVTVRHNWASFMAIPFRVLRPRGFFRHKAPLTVRGGHALDRIAGHLRGEAKSMKEKKRTLKKQCPFISCLFSRTVRGALCLKKTYGVWGSQPQSLTQRRRHRYLQSYPNLGTNVSADNRKIRLDISARSNANTNSTA